MPTRYLKPGIRDSETIDNLSPMAECLFYRLLVTVDDFGRYDARPAMIRSACYPIRESMTAAKCEALLKELEQCGLVCIYAQDGKPFLQMRKWDNIPRTKESKYPAMSDACMHMYTDARQVNANAPLTKTETETETETETKTETTSRKRSPSLPCPDDVSTQVWDDWQQLRKTKKAPVTKTVLDGARGQAAIAGMTLENFLIVWCRRGSQGLEAAWLKPDERGCVQSSGETAYQRSMRERIEEVSPDIARKRPGEKAQSAVDFFRTVDVAATIVEMKELEARK